jgi:hypothetical protein
MQSQNQNQEELDFNYFFRKDILKLFNAFEEMRTLRYTDFVKLWNQFKFYQIFS